MHIEREVMEAFVKDFNNNYLTIEECAKSLGYSRGTALTKKIRKLKLGIKIKGFCLLSKEDQKLLKNNIKRRNRDFLEKNYE